MIPERNGVVIRFPNYGNRYGRCDVYKLPGFGYAFIANIVYSQNDDDVPQESIDADVDTNLSDQVLEKDLKNGYTMIIVPDKCVTVLNDWTVHEWRRK